MPPQKDSDFPKNRLWDSEGFIERNLLRQWNSKCHMY